MMYNESKIKSTTAFLLVIVIMSCILTCSTAFASDNEGIANSVYYSGYRISHEVTVETTSDTKVWTGSCMATVPKKTTIGTFTYYIGRFQGIYQDNRYYHGFVLRMIMNPTQEFYATYTYQGKTTKYKMYGANEFLEVTSDIPTKNRYWTHDDARTTMMYLGGDIASMVPTRELSGSTSYSIPTSVSALYGTLSKAIVPDVAYCEISQNGRNSTGKFDATYDYKKYDALCMCNKKRAAVVYDESEVFAACYWFCKDNYYKQDVSMKIRFTISPAKNNPLDILELKKNGYKSVTVTTKETIVFSQ